MDIVVKNSTFSLVGNSIPHPQTGNSTHHPKTGNPLLHLWRRSWWCLYTVTTPNQWAGDIVLLNSTTSKPGNPVLGQVTKKYTLRYDMEGLAYWEMINMRFCQNPVECQPVQLHVHSSEWMLNKSVVKWVNQYAEFRGYLISSVHANFIVHEMVKPHVDCYSNVENSAECWQLTFRMFCFFMKNMQCYFYENCYFKDITNMFNLGALL